MALIRKVSPIEYAVLVLIGALSFLPFLGAAPLFDWDEINFAESAREMIVTGNYFQVQIDFKPFWEKPPLFIWMQVLCMKVFGIHEFAARLPNAIFGVLTLCVLYRWAARFLSVSAGQWVTAFFFVTILPFAYFKSGIIDPVFNFFIFLGLARILYYEWTSARGKEDRKSPWLAGLWIGLATLTKGPVALLVTLLVYFGYKLIWDRRIPWKAILTFTLMYLAVILTWFGSIILFTEEGAETVRKFIVYQAELFSQDVAGHARPFYYHFLVFTFGCFPMAAFAYRGMFLRFGGEDPGHTMVKRFMLLWFWVVMLLFSMATTKIVHYSSLLYYPGAFLAGLYFQRLVEGRKRPTWDIYLLYGFGMLVFGGLVGSAPWLVGALQSEVNIAGDGSGGDGYIWGALHADVPWTGWEFLPGAFFLVALATGLYFLIRRRYHTWLIVMGVAVPLYLNGVNALLLPRIADHTQNAAVRFFREKAGENAYLMVDGYKSYAHYFYGRVQPFPHPEIPPEERGAWMARGPVDRPVYLVTHLGRGQNPDFGQFWFPEFELLYQEGGFEFYYRPLPTPGATAP